MIYYKPLSNKDDELFKRAGYKKNKDGSYHFIQRHDKLKTSIINYTLYEGINYEEVGEN